MRCLRGFVGRCLANWCLLAVAVQSVAQAAGAPGGAPGGGSPDFLPHGGLVVLLDCPDWKLPAEIASTGRYLVHVLQSDRRASEKLQEDLQSQGLYGLASVEQLPEHGALPYAENLVNAIWVLVGQGHSARTATSGAAGAGVASGLPGATEIFRVLCPNGVLIAERPWWSDEELKSAGFETLSGNTSGSLQGGRKMYRKAWPASMDQWTHPRHAADGNAVSADALVGPPRRVRWIAGPQEEVANMVSAAGRNFYGGVLARDAFNGLRLWERTLNPSPARGGYNFQFRPGSVHPVAIAQRLYAVTDGQLVALDAATGKTVQVYPQAGTPSEILYEAGLLLAVAPQSICAVDAQTGQLRWQLEAAQPRCVVAGDGKVFFLHGAAQRGEMVRLSSLELASGRLRWEQRDYQWLGKTRQCVYSRDRLVCEVSTLSDDGAGNAIHVLSASDGQLLWSRQYVPGMTHKKQARALSIGEFVWVLEEKRCVALDRDTGQERHVYPAGTGHCFPPVATVNYLFAGELDMTDLRAGTVEANRITKGNCSRDAGWVPANGLVYTGPKHCVCWPMLRDYTALAPGTKDDLVGPLGVASFVPQRGPAVPPEDIQPGAAAEPSDLATDQWPCYRHDAWRSGSTPARLPTALKVLWSRQLGGWPTAVIAEDWRHNYFIRAPIGPPVVAGGLVYVARPDAHQVLALDAATGQTRWSFTANGRVDTAPTIHRGLCLFGCKSGWVYCLRADDGRLVWRLRAAPRDRRIVAYGQLESPWPVPGSVLVVDDLAYFAAGRQPLADGGVLVFAVEPRTGQVRWLSRIDSVPQTNFYGSSGLEFDNFDLLQLQGDSVAMSRWLLRREDGAVTCDARNGFAHIRTGNSGGVMFPRGSWSYAPRNETERWKERPFLRPLVVFRGDTLFGCSQDRQTVFRRDFDLDGEDRFDPEWYSGWTTYQRASKGGDLWQSQRLVRLATWSTTPLLDGKAAQPVAAMLLAANALYVVGSGGQLGVLSLDDGEVIERLDVAPPAWDGLAAASGRIYLSTQDGQVLCLAAR